jgi:hypothetical protein
MSGNQLNLWKGTVVNKLCLVVYGIIPLIGTMIALISAVPAAKPKEYAMPKRELGPAYDFRAEERAQQVAREHERTRDLAEARALCARYPRDLYIDSDGLCVPWPQPERTIVIEVRRP